MASVTTYHATALKTIGKQCSQRLPPANAVQAMFLYEMQRQSESEELFRNQMFQLARNEDASARQQQRIEHLEAKVMQLQQVTTNKEVEERLVASKSTMQMLAEKVNGCLKRIEGLEAVMEKAKSRIEAIERGLEEKKAEAAEEEAPASNAAFETMMKAEIDVLFQDRDGMLAMIVAIQERIASLEVSTTANATATGTASSHPAKLTCAAPVTVTNTINGGSLTNGAAEVNQQSHRICSAAAAKKAVEQDEADKMRLFDEELGRQIAQMDIVEKAEEEREKAFQVKRAKEKEAAEAKEAERAAKADEELKRRQREAEEREAVRQREREAEAAIITSGAAPPHLRPCLTRNKTASLTDVTNGSRTQTQRLPVQMTSSSSAAPLDLSIPKGAPLVSLRASAHAPSPLPAPSNLRSFSPGKPWAS